MKIIYPNMGSVAQVENAIEKAIESATTMKKKIQIASIGLLILAGKAKDAKDTAKCLELANYLVDQCGNGINGRGLVAFLAHYGFKVDVIEPKNGFNALMSNEYVRKHFEDAKKGSTEGDLKGYWWDWRPVNAFKPWDFKVELKKLLDRADKMSTDDEHKADITIDKDLLEVARSMLEGTPVHAAGALKLVEALAA